MAAGDFRDRLLAGLGGSWPEACPLKPKVLDKTQAGGFRIENITCEVEPDDRVPSLLLVRDGVSPNKPAPGICL